jgi:hypothetical protein
MSAGKPCALQAWVLWLKALHWSVMVAGVNLMALSLFCPDKIKMHRMTLAHFGPALA